MEKVYMICIIIGTIIPLLTFILGSIGDILEGVFGGLFDCLDAIGFDFSVDIFGIDFCLLPFSLQCLSGGVLIYGGVGKLMYNGHNLILTNIVAAISGYLTAVLFQSLIHKLKKVENTTYSKEQLLLFDAKVIHSIVKNGYGSISVSTFDGITTEYPAKALNKDEVIRQDTLVRIVRFEGNTAIVEKKNDWDLK